MPFLPVTKQDLAARGWQQLDIILISGDAYIDHPSFGVPIIARSLEAAGYKVGIIAQPDWHKDEDFLALGKPRLFFGVSAGNMDSMVNHYTAQRRIRSDDAYSPGGLAGKRPDRAVMIYTNILRRLFKGTPVVIGGIEASLRRIAHYDYWQNKIRNSILADSKADILVYGMAESPIVALARELERGRPINEITDLPATVCFSKEPGEHILPAADKCAEKQIFHQLNRQFYAQYQKHEMYQLNGGRWIKHNPPAPPPDTAELDRIFALPFMNAPHPMYKGQRFPAWDQIKQSITSHRGCYGGCNFCAIAVHQGRHIQSRSANSILKEARKLSGSISDVGGPSANMYKSRCKLDFPDSCPRRSCVFPDICPNLRLDHDAQVKLLEDIANLPNVKHVFVASGIRHDLAIGNKRYIQAIAKHYTGGRLKLAPEHSAPNVLKLMGKPPIERFEAFSKEYFEEVRQAGIKRQIIPYIIIGHPGTTMDDAFALKHWLDTHKIQVEQVQEFTPTPMTISTCMYYTGLDFETGKPIHIPAPGEIRKQKELIVKPKGSLRGNASRKQHHA
jgi:uncharacterized radical SAM protein YgiQ